MTKPGISLRNCAVDLLREAYFERNNPEKKHMLNRVRLVEDFTPSDFKLRKYLHQ